MRKSFLLFISLLCAIAINAQEATFDKRHQLIKNPSFEEEANPIRNRRFGSNGEGELFGGRLPAGIIPGWIIPEEKDSATKIEISTDKLLEGQYKALCWKITEVPSAIANVGNQGIEVFKGGKYVLTFWARADKRYKGTLTVGLQDRDEATWCAKAKVKGCVGKKWKK